ncbi:MAG: OmpA family protein [Alphaproteobacteria bacterium]
MRALYLFGCLLLVAGCASKSEKLAELNKVSANGTPFTQRLTTEYRAFANRLQNEGHDNVYADHFAQKGLLSAQGKIVAPENPAKWNISDKKAKDNLLTSSKQLDDVLRQGGRTKAADETAVAQATFDCWTQQTEKSGAAVESCRKGFITALNMATKKLKETAPAPVISDNTPAVQSAPVAEQEKVAPENMLFMVFFDWNKANINQSAGQVLDTVATEASQVKPPAIEVVGHTDLSGSARYNQKLSERRANAVREGLVARGVASDIISAKGAGLTMPLVATDVGVREPANRRAEIRFDAPAAEKATEKSAAPAPVHSATEHKIKAPAQIITDSTDAPPAMAPVPVQ